MRKSFIVYLPFCIILLVLIFMAGAFGKKEKMEESLPESDSGTSLFEFSVPEESIPAEETEEGFVSAVWIPYYVLQSDSEENFRLNYDKQLKTAKSAGVNTVFVHVRPYCDAVYSSEYYPISHIVTGEQGAKLSSDPLEYMVERAHEEGLKFHAWLNPLRVKIKNVPQSFSSDSLISELSEEYPYYFLNVGEGIYLNPAYSYVRRIIADGAAEIAADYAVDGIQFDDYFYPEEIGEADLADYELYKEGAEIPMSIEEWRMANISSMVAETYSSIKAANSSVLFGISPQGNMQNNYSISADVKTWCAVKGYIDYICPQLYFSYDNPALGFLDSMLPWTETPKHSELKLWAGLALYKAGTDSDSGTWLNSENMLARQIIDLQNAGFTGAALFDISQFSRETAKEEIMSVAALLQS